MAVESRSRDLSFGPYSRGWGRVGGGQPFAKFLDVGLTRVAAGEERGEIPGPVADGVHDAGGVKSLVAEGNGVVEVS